MSGEKLQNRGEVIPRSFFTKITVVLAVFSIVVAVAGQIFLYLQTKTFLAFHYSAVLLKLARIKDGIFLKSVLVSFGFFIIPCLLATFFLVVYSHRVAGPMFRVKQYLKALSGEITPRLIVTDHGANSQRSSNHGTSGHRVPQVAASGTAMRTFVREPDRSSQDVAPCDRLRLISFREKDVLHVLANSINAVQHRERDDFARISANLAEIEQTLAKALAAQGEGRPIESLLGKIDGKCAENNGIMEAVKL